MPQYTPMLRAASRVLMAIAERQRPSDEDVAELRRFAPDHAHEELDELACHVVHEAMGMRRQQGAASADD
jgi:hypothetical protein